MIDPNSLAPRYTHHQREEAAEWFVQINEAKEPDAETLQAWLRWMEAEEGNRLAFEAVLDVWRIPPEPPVVALPSTQELAADLYDGMQTVADWNASHPKSTPRSIWRTRLSGSGPRLADGSRRRLTVASWLAAAAASVLVALVWSQMAQRGSGEYQTNTGEQLQIALADGSHVWLGAKSRFVVEFTKEARGVRLETGEAFFSVAKDPIRPFTVRSLDDDITAVGTAFDVRAVADRLTVAVTEGAVTVHASEKLSMKLAVPDERVASGQELTIDGRKPIERLAVVRSANPGERSRWRDGVLVYHNEALRVVVADLARYSDRHLDISGDDIGELRFSGAVDTNAVDEWAAALVESFPVKLVTDHDRLSIVAR